MTLALCRSALLILLLEAIHATSRIHQLLTASEEGVATGADFHSDVAFVCRTRLEHVAARANYIQLVIGGVNSSFHLQGTFRKLLV